MALLINPYRFNSFTPASLFQGGTYKGVWIDPSDLSSLKQDTGGSTAVTADSDPVARIADKSGNAAVYTRDIDDTRRALYKVVSGYSCLRFDGVARYSGDANARLATDNVSGFTIMAVVSITSTSAYALDSFTVTGQGTSTSFVTTSAGPETWHIGTNLQGGAISSNTKVLMTIIVNGASSVIRKNGTQTNSGTLANNTGTCSAAHLGHENGSYRFNGDVYQYMRIARVLSGADLTDCEAFFAARGGVSI